LDINKKIEKKGNFLDHLFVLLSIQISEHSNSEPGENKMNKESIQDQEKKLEIGRLGPRVIEADFSAGRVSSDGGALLLREVDKKLRLTERLAQCFKDYRKVELIEHTVEQIIAQRVYGLALGYEDLNDHEELSKDPLLASVVGKKDPLGELRRSPKDRGNGLASASTLGRLERTEEDANEKSRYEKIVCNFESLSEVFLQIFIESFKYIPPRLIIDLDPSDIQLHGQQEERFYHGYYHNYCYLPMYIFCGQYPLFVSLRPANIDGAKGSVEMLEKVVTYIRKSFPDTHIIIRGDSGFCRENLMNWCEQNSIDYVFGISKNKRLEKVLEKKMKKAKSRHFRSGQPVRFFKDFFYRTLKGWSRKRRVIGKAEYLSKGGNPRFVVTSLLAKEFEKRYVYEELYCARGEMENRIKEQQLDLFGNRASGHKFRTNSVRLWLSAAAHLLIVCLRKIALEGTELCNAQATTIRVKMLKIGALFTMSVRRIYIRLSSAYPLKNLFYIALNRLKKEISLQQVKV
jgi:hypothetical protein